MKVSVLGCGRWGSFLAWYADKIGHDVMLWGRDGSAKYKELKETRRNEYLQLSEKVKLTNSLADAARHAETIVISISAQSLRSLAKQLRELGISEQKIFVLCMKGLELKTGKRLSAVFGEEMGGGAKVAVWVGPGHVQDFVRGVPNCMIIGSADKKVSQTVVSSFSSRLIRFYYGEDLTGIEIGAAAKNVIGIAAGMLDGLEYGSLKGALMARGTKELSRLIQAIGGDGMTVYGLSHLGDYEATLFSAHSNNRRFGERFVRGGRFEKLAEGVPTVEALLCLAEQYYVELPICRVVYEIVKMGRDPKEQLLGLFLRPIKAE